MLPKSAVSLRNTTEFEPTGPESESVRFYRLRLRLRLRPKLPTPTDSDSDSDSDSAALIFIISIFFKTTKEIKTKWPKSEEKSEFGGGWIGAPLQVCSRTPKSNPPPLSPPPGFSSLDKIIGPARVSGRTSISSAPFSWASVRPCSRTMAGHGAARVAPVQCKQNAKLLRDFENGCMVKYLHRYKGKRTTVMHSFLIVGGG